MKQKFQIEIETPRIGYELKITDVYKTNEMYICIVQLKCSHPSRIEMCGHCEDSLELEVEKKLPIKYYLPFKSTQASFLQRRFNKNRVTHVPDKDSIPELLGNHELIYKNENPNFKASSPFFSFSKTSASETELPYDGIANYPNRP